MTTNRTWNERLIVYCVPSKLIQWYAAAHQIMLAIALFRRREQRKLSVRMNQSSIQQNAREFERSAARFEKRKQEQLRQIRAGKLAVKEADQRNFALAPYVDCKITVR